jgi:hypothetical protein
MIFYGAAKFAAFLFPLIGAIADKIDLKNTLASLYYLWIRYLFDKYILVFFAFGYNFWNLHFNHFTPACFIFQYGIQ